MNYIASNFKKIRQECRELALKYDGIWIMCYSLSRKEYYPTGRKSDGTMNADNPEKQFIVYKNGKVEKINKF